MPKTKSKHISIQLLARIFSGYLLVAIAITASQIFLEYQNEHDILKKQIDSIASTFMPTLSEALWNYDEEQIIAGIKGMKKIEDIADATVQTPNQSYQFKTEANSTIKDQPFLIAQAPDILYEQRYPILSPGNDSELLGELIIQSSSKTVLSRTYHTFAITIISALFKTFCLWLIAYYFISKIVRTPINQLREDINAFDINDLQQIPPSATESQTHNEIDFLKHHFDQLSHDLKTKNRELTNSHADLERKVDERTRALQKTLTDLEKANKVKANFLCQISHELRTPLNSIIGYSKKIRDRLSQLDDDRVQHGIRAVIHNGEHLSSLVNDLLDSSQAESGKLELDLKNTPLQPIFSEILETLQPTAESKQIELSIAAPVITAIEADGQRLRQILFNLLSNAIKFTERGRVTLNTHLEQNNGIDGLRFDIEDTGCGIDADDVSRIFQEFEQLGHGSGSHVIGTGLGLAITRHLIQMHHGNIHVKSQKGVGSTFQVWLPIQQHSQRTGRPPAHHAA